MELRKILQSQLDSVEGLYQLYIADRDGVPVITVTSQSNADSVLRPQLLASYQAAIEQTGKLGLGAHKQMICSYGRVQLVLFNMYPLTITLIASNEASTGQLLQLRHKFEPLVNQIKAAVDSELAKIPS